MPVIVDNNFTRDSYGIRLERLATIEANLTLIQTELMAPAEIVTWAETCHSAFSDLMTEKDVESSESEAATLDASIKGQTMEEEYQNAKTFLISFLQDQPYRLKEFKLDVPFPTDRRMKIEKAEHLLEVNERQISEGVTPNLPPAIVTRLTVAISAYEEALNFQDVEREEMLYSSLKLSELYEKDSAMLQKLRAWWYVMMGKNDPRITLIGMVNPEPGGRKPTVPDAPSEITFYLPTTTFSISPVSGASSFSLEFSPDGISYEEVYSGSEPDCVFVPPQSGWSFFRARARNSGGFSQYSLPFRIGYYPGTVLPAPENLVIQLAAGSPNTIELNWTPVPSATTYTVNRSIVAIGAGPGPFSFVTNTHDPEYVETVIPGNRFYYNLTASNSSQWSGVSATVFIDVV